MRAVQVVGPDLGVSGLRASTIDAPVAGPGEVVVEVVAVSASRLDLTALGHSAMGQQNSFPRTLGGDPAGVIVAVGEGVEGSRVGSRVVVKPNLFCGECEECLAGAEADCRSQVVLGLRRDGGAAEAVVVPARSAFGLPDAVTFVDAAAAVHTFPVALHMIRVAGGISTGDVVVVTGAAGAVGSATVQLVAALGGRVVAVVQDEAQARFIGDLKAHAVVRVDERTLSQAVHDVCPDGVNLVIDTTGAAAVLGEAIDTLGWRGRAVTCAGASQPRLSLDTGAFYRRRLALFGSASSDVRDVVDSLDLLAAGSITPKIGRVYPFDDFRQAYASLVDPTRNGKVVIRVRDE